MANYYRITAYYPEKDFSVILDSDGKFEKLWQFSAYLVEKGFKIIQVGAKDKLIDASFPTIESESTKILLRRIVKGHPEIEEMTYQGVPSKAITVYNKTYGQYI